MGHRYAIPGIITSFPNVPGRNSENYSFIIYSLFEKIHQPQLYISEVLQLYLESERFLHLLPHFRGELAEQESMLRGFIPEYAVCAVVLPSAGNCGQGATKQFSFYLEH